MPRLNRTPCDKPKEYDEGTAIRLPQSGELYWTPDGNVYHWSQSQWYLLEVNEPPEHEERR